MVKGTLQMALDFCERKDVAHETVSYRLKEKWHIVNRGPKYSNTYIVTDYDEVGLAWLKAHEQPLPSLGQTEEGNPDAIR